MAVLLVTGGGGFVMCHLARHWVGRTAGNVAVVVDRDPLDAPARKWFRPCGARARFVRGDVADAAFWEGLPARIADLDPVAYVAHGAAVSSIERHRRAGGLAAALPAVEVNVMGTARALAFAETLPSLKRFLNVSSGAVFARETDLPLGVPLPEDGHVAPDGLYPVSKYAAELLVRQTARDSGLPAITVRLASVFGPLDRETSGRALDSVPKRLMMAAHAGRSPTVAGLDSVGDYLAAGDVAAAMAALLTCAAPRHPVYNVAAGRLTTLSELIALIVDLDPGFEVREAPPGEAEIVGVRPATAGRNGAYDISRIEADTDWRPAGLAAGLRDYRDWLAVRDV